MSVPRGSWLFVLVAGLLVSAGCEERKPKQPKPRGETQEPEVSKSASKPTSNDPESNPQPAGKPEVVAENTTSALSTVPGLTLGTWRFQVQGDECSGTYSLHAAPEDESKLLRIEEEMVLTFRGTRFDGKTLSYKSLVRYATDPEFVPVEATVQTMMEGKPGTHVSISFDAGTIVLKGVGLLDTDGNPVQPPKEFDSSDAVPLKDIWLFESAIPILGPALLEAEGELDDIVLVRFPDDWFVETRTEPAKFAKGDKLKRIENEDGTFRIDICHRNSDSARYSARYDAQGRLMSIEHFLRLHCTLEGQKRGDCSKEIGHLLSGSGAMEGFGGEASAVRLEVAEHVEGDSGDQM